MTAIYLIAGALALWFWGRVTVRRFHRWRKHDDRRSSREFWGAVPLTFVAWGIFSLTLGGLIELPRGWLAVGVGATVGAFVVAGWMFDQEDASDGP